MNLYMRRTDPFHYNFQERKRECFKTEFGGCSFESLMFGRFWGGEESETLEAIKTERRYRKKHFVIRFINQNKK